MLVAKKRKLSRKEIRKAIRKQLQYIKRNLAHIDQLTKAGASLEALRIDWNNFNESGELKVQVEAFKEATGVYPESVHVDRIYRTRENRAFCKEKGIRISGSPLGRPPAHVSESKKRQAREDERIRNRIEGKFGVSKRRFSLNRVMAKLPHTSQTAIAITFLVMNVSVLLRQVFLNFFVLSILFTPFLESMINSNYTRRIVNKKSSSFLKAYITI